MYLNFEKLYVYLCRLTFLKLPDFKMLPDEVSDPNPSPLTTHQEDKIRHTEPLLRLVLRFDLDDDPLDLI